MPAGAKLETAIIHPGSKRNCDLPDWEFATVTRWGKVLATIKDPAHIADLYRLRGPSMWLGYDHIDGAVGKATNSHTWFEVNFYHAGEKVAQIIFRKNEHGHFCWWMASMDQYADKNGEHYGPHPCAVFEVWQHFVNEWLARVSAGD